MKNVKNPYTLAFGKTPEQIISRTTDSMQVMDMFSDEHPAHQAYMITGVRGSGKTVFMTDVAKKLAADKQWVTVELNQEKDLLEGLASKLASEHELANIFRSAKIDLSFWGFGVKIEGTVPITDIETAITKMLKCFKKHERRLLVTIDEVTDNVRMREFAASFQIFMRQDLPIYLMMTGLYENINSLQNEKSLTFLYRTPRIELKPLNIGTISRNYREVLKVDENTALAMAKQTKGYSFAFQVLGYFTWINDGDYRKAYGDFRQYLDEFVYQKIWAELSSCDKKVCNGIALSQNGKVQEIRNALNMDGNNFNQYRDRLIKKGLINGEEHGYVRFVLPEFDRFVIENYHG